jgi:glycosyltransferase involved in cell wall biosynthesis
LAIRPRNANTAPRVRTVCMVVHAYYPLAEPRVQREASAARDAGFDVTVLSLRNTGEPRAELVDGIRVRRVRLRHRRGAGVVRALLEYVAFVTFASAWLAARSVRRPFDIVHLHSPPDFLVLAGLPARVRGSKLVLDIHDLSSHMLAVRASGTLARIASVALVWVERLACTVVDAVITVHAQYRHELIAHGVPAEKIRVVMNSVDAAVLERARTVASQVARSPAFRLAYHGTLTWWYGADLIVDALAQLGAEELGMDAIILGDGDSLSALRQQVADRGLTSRVHLSGRYLPIEQALATVSEADCGVIPNRPSEINRFALSSKLFEYVALGIPVVVARLETLTAHFSSDEVTFFDPGNASSLADAIRWVHDHPAEAASKADGARLRAEQYSWARGRQTLTGLYRELAGASLPRS